MYPDRLCCKDTISDQKFLKVRSLLFCDYRLVGAEHGALSLPLLTAQLTLVRRGLGAAPAVGQSIPSALGAVESLDPLWDMRRWEGKRGHQPKSQRRQMTSRRKGTEKTGHVPTPVREDGEGASESCPVPVSKRKTLLVSG